MKMSESEKDELLTSYLSEEVLGDKELTASAKLLLAYIHRWYCAEKTQENGYCFRSNKAIMKDLDFGSEHTLIDARNLLTRKGHIRWERGRRRNNQATKYYLTCKDAANITKPQHPSECSNHSGECSNQECSIFQAFQELQEKVKKLERENAILKRGNPQSAAKQVKCSNKCSTDIDVDKVKELSTIVDTKKKTTTQQTTSTRSDIIGDNDNNSDIQSIQSKQPDTDALREANDFFTKKKIRLIGEDNKGGMFKSLHDTKQKEVAKMYIDAIRKDIISLRTYKYCAYFSDRQRECINRWERMVDKAEADKAEYFKRGELMEQEYQAKLAAEKAVEAGYSVNIRQQSNTSAPVNDRDKMDADNEFTNSLLGDSSEVKTYHYGRKSNRQALDFEDLKRTAVEYAQADYSEDVMQAKCREYVYMHSAGYGKDGQDNIYQVMMNCINDAREQVSSSNDIQ